mgnify:FL=1
MRETAKDAFGNIIDQKYDYFFRDKNYIKLDEEHSLWHVHMNNVFDDEVLKRIENFVSDKELNDALVMGSEYASDNEKIRSTKMIWMTSDDFSDELLDVYEYISDLVRSVNNDLWGYNIIGWEPLQYLEYWAEEKGRFDWHIDIPARRMKGNQRKVSFMIGLSDVSEYEGGYLQLRLGVDDRNIKLGRGEIVILPSFIVHRVTTVTKGKRRVVSGWGSGPNFV